MKNRASLPADRRAADRETFAAELGSLSPRVLAPPSGAGYTPTPHHFGRDSASQRADRIIRMPPSPLLPGSYSHSASLVDLLDRVLDKGLVVAGDIKVSLAEVELLTIRIRLLICSIDKAEQIGLDWWRNDKNLSSGRLAHLPRENEDLRKQIRLLERKIASRAGSRPAARVRRHNAARE